MVKVAFDLDFLRQGPLSVELEPSSPKRVPCGLDFDGVGVRTRSVLRPP